MSSTAPIADLTRVWVPLPELAAIVSMHEVTLRRLIKANEVIAREREHGKGAEVDALSLPPKYRVRYLAANPLAAIRGSDADRDEISRYLAAQRISQKLVGRADLRHEAVLSFRKAREEAKANGERLADAEARWEYNFRRKYPSANASIRSVKDWDKAFAEHNLNGLVDLNDGLRQRGTRIPEPAKQLFRDLYMSGECRKIRVCWKRICEEAAISGWGEMPPYVTFWRFAKSEISKLDKLLTRERVDRPRSVLPCVRRDPTSIPAMHTIQMDHREIDVPVRCDRGCAVCAPPEEIRRGGRRRKPQARGHFPIWSAWIDIRSRMVLGWTLSIEAPTGRTVLALFGRVISERGLPVAIYVDNGADIRKAFGKRLRKLGRSSWDGPEEAEMQSRLAALGVKVIYAIPYNAQAKPIERMFRTFRENFDQDFEAFRASFGAKTEMARELFYKPHELPTVSELAYLLQMAVDRYNVAEPHSGRGMDDRTPQAVFEEMKRDAPAPHREAFAYLFYEPVSHGGTRVVDNNGVRIDRRDYRLTSLEAQSKYYGCRVAVRIHPDSPLEAIVLDLQTGAYICDAKADAEDATYSFDDEVTRARWARVLADGRELQRMAHAQIEGAAERLAIHKRHRIEYYQRYVAPLVIRPAIVGDDGRAVQLLGSLSAIARDRAVALSEAIAPAPESAPVATPEAVWNGGELCDDDRVTLARLRKVAAHACEIDGCEARVRRDQLCGHHYVEIFGDDLTADEIQKLIE